VRPHGEPVACRCPGSEHIGDRDGVGLGLHLDGDRREEPVKEPAEERAQVVRGDGPAHHAMATHLDGERNRTGHEEENRAGQKPECQRVQAVACDEEPNRHADAEDIGHDGQQARRKGQEEAAQQTESRGRDNRDSAGEDRQTEAVQCPLGGRGRQCAEKMRVRGPAERQRGQHRRQQHAQQQARAERTAQPRPGPRTDLGRDPLHQCPGEAEVDQEELHQGTARGHPGAELIERNVVQVDGHQDDVADERHQNNQVAEDGAPDRGTAARRAQSRRAADGSVDGRQGARSGVGEPPGAAQPHVSRSASLQSTMVDLDLLASGTSTPVQRLARRTRLSTN
jgi:hypothetical protein